MSLLVQTPLVGLEQVQRKAFYALFDQLNDTIAEIEAEMNVSDLDFNEHTGRTVPPTVVERIEPDNFIEGHKPSLIKAAIDRYPNCSVWALRANPTAESALLDHQTVYRDLLYVETMVKAIEDEETVNRRAHRTAEAVNIVMLRNKTLGGTVSGFTDEPSLEMSDVFTRKERTAYGPHWFWQGVRLTYAVRKDAVMPSSSGSSFRGAGAFMGIDIDQPTP